ncbi:MAG: hypothetical protein KatS3mg057_1256 [Herpetosiphonaceae bacterium]|nr:MAG: hypothetical protein KatS3mg057_1256 [Herpetosiphonaceae bacterium]
MRFMRALALLALVMLLSGAVLPAAARVEPSESIWITGGPADWQAGYSHGLLTAAGPLILSPHAQAAPVSLGKYNRYGLFDSPIRTLASFRRVQVDYSAHVPAGSELLVMVRASADGSRWTEWESAQPGAIISFDRVARYLQYRAALLGNDRSPVLNSVKLTPLPLTESDLQRNALEEPVAPTYRIRATRQGMVGSRTANGHVVRYMDRFVSLPSWRSLSSRGGGEYMVRLTNPMNGRSAIAPVWDVGPWNRHDDYWNEDREWYKDLPLGWPEDHAAFYWGYNGGYAEVSGKVLWAAAVDVGDGTWTEDLGIDFENEQATLLITFLWKGSDPGPDPEIQPGPPPRDYGDGAYYVDDLVAGFTLSKSVWFEVKCGHDRHAWWTYSTTDPAQSSHAAIWRPTLPKDGDYDVWVHVPYCVNWVPDSRDVRYEVHHHWGVDIVSVNQKAEAGRWVGLGRWHFKAGDAGFVRLADLAGDHGRSVWFDAIKWVPVP